MMASILREGNTVSLLGIKGEGSEGGPELVAVGRPRPFTKTNVLSAGYVEILG
jgi:hypothetical protein